MPLRAVVFDLDNTLILEDRATLEAVRAAVAVARARAGVDADALERSVVETAETLWRSSPEYRYGEIFGVWWGEALWGGFRGEDEASRALRAFVPGYREAVWRGALAHTGVDDRALAEALAEEYVRARRSHEVLDPDAASVLAALARTRKLALLTNGAGDVQREKLSRTPFADAFDAIVISVEVGVGKPDPRIFEIALERLGVAAGDAAMVGDSLVRDVGGARRAGVATVWIDRGLWDEEGPEPDAVIRRLSDLPAVLDDLERRRASLRAMS